MMELSKEYLKMKSEAASGTPRRTIHNAAVATVCAHNNAQVSTGKKVRHVFIEATFPELKGGQMYQHAHGEASGTKPAIARAFKNLLKTIPKKRISVIKATISITTKIVEDSSV